MGSWRRPARPSSLPPSPWALLRWLPRHNPVGRLAAHQWWRLSLGAAPALALPLSDPKRLPRPGVKQPPNGSLMRALFWNICGFGHDGRRHQLTEYVRDQHIDIVAIQETMHSDFSLPELDRLSTHLFAWHWLPSSGNTGHSGGILHLRGGEYGPGPVLC